MLSVDRRYITGLRTTVLVVNEFVESGFLGLIPCGLDHGSHPGSRLERLEEMR